MILVNISIWVVDLLVKAFRSGVALEAENHHVSLDFYCVIVE